MSLPILLTTWSVSMMMVCDVTSKITIFRLQGDVWTDIAPQISPTLT